jgi:PAS domain S-box-containing protein
MNSPTRNNDEHGKKTGLHEIWTTDDQMKSYREMIETSHQGIIVSSPDRTILFANSPVALIFGYDSVDEFMGLDSTRHILANHELKRLDEKRKARFERTEVSDISSYDGRRKDGSTIRVQEISRLVEWCGMPAIEARITDNSELWRTQKLLEEAQKHIGAIFDNIPIMLCLKGTDGRFKQANERFAEWHGVAVHDIPGVTSHELMLEDRANAVEDIDRKVIETGEVIIEEIESELQESESGSGRIFQMIKFPIQDAGGNVTAVGTAMMDITVQKEAQGALQAALQDAERANQAKSEFLASMSHELRTPLNAIIGFSEMITEEVWGTIGNDRYHEYLVDIHGSGHHLLHLVNDILDLEKIEAGQFDLHESDVNTDELLTYCLRMIKGRKESSSISFLYEAPAGLPLVRADERILRQIVLNPLANAVKYNNTEGTITLSAYMNEENGISIVVSDTGIGISAEHISVVLEPFGQARTNAHLSHEGTGLGLSLSKQLIRLHGGTLELESEVGKGTTVTIKLPPERIISG